MLSHLSFVVRRSGAFTARSRSSAERRTANAEPPTAKGEPRTPNDNVPVKPTILIVDDEPGVRTALSGVLRDEGYSVEAVVERRGLPRARHARRRRSHRARRLAARHGRAGDAGAPARAPGGCAGRADLRPRQHRVGGARDQAGRVRLRREAAVAREDRARRPQRAAPAAARGREPRPARARRSAPDDGRRELRHAPAARAGRDGGADQRPRAHLRRERHRQGAGGADDSRARAAAGRRRSSRSTAPRFPRS